MCTNMVLREEKVSCLERCPYFRGVLIEGFHCMLYDREAVNSWGLGDI